MQTLGNLNLVAVHVFIGKLMTKTSRGIVQHGTYALNQSACVDINTERRIDVSAVFFKHISMLSKDLLQITMVDDCIQQLTRYRLTANIFAFMFFH